MRPDQCRPGGKHTMQMQACQGSVSLRVCHLKPFPRQEPKLRNERLYLLYLRPQRCDIVFPDDAQISFLLRACSTIKSMNVVFDTILVLAPRNRTRRPDENRSACSCMPINRSKSVESAGRLSGREVKPS